MPEPERDGSEEPREVDPRALPAGGLKRRLLHVLGLVFVGCGAVGAFLPLVPTTPFLLLAGACFARSSPRLNARLLESRVFGPYLKQWRAEHTVPPDAKRRAYALVVLSFAVSIALVDETWQRGLLLGIGALLLLFLARLPTG